MPYRDLYVFFNFIAIFHCINGEISLKKNEKHADITNNYDTCFESFDVHTNKIIKTEDSCDLGAKYLNVLDLESREDCFKYCCDTDKCDVFIFEEKVSINIIYNLLFVYQFIFKSIILHELLETRKLLLVWMWTTWRFQM